MPTNPVHHPLADGYAPDWASEWGQDRFGPFAAFEVDGVIQRMRWIPPGWFWMGSPDEETRGLAKEDHERPWFAAEHPLHRVRIARGFWLFETPCTQALWQAVMGENPSRFQDPDRPVEQVSWQDAQGFIAGINDRMPGLDLCLPSEAQWEYGCRAGTDTALYSGPIKIIGERDAPALDAIAWYGGNSGVDYDLDEAQDTASWPDKQYETARAGSRKVKGKAPNRWGLYDMLGNVYEWVEDGWHQGFEGAPDDGSAWLADDDPDRVMRGGSSGSEARHCRCAARAWNQPGGDSSGLGFRCARVQW